MFIYLNTCTLTSSFLLPLCNVLVDQHTYTQTHTIVFRRHDRHRRRCSLLVPTKTQTTRKSILEPVQFTLSFFSMCAQSLQQRTVSLSDRVDRPIVAFQFSKRHKQSVV